MLNIFLEKIKDESTRDALADILNEFKKQVMLNFNWTPFEVTFTAGISDFRFRHNLGFRPKDVVITDISNEVDGFIDLDTATSQYVSITVSGPTTMRFLLGNLNTNSQF